MNKKANYQPSLTQKTVSATKWSAGFAIIQQIFGLIVTIILARLLAPEDFGTMAIIIAFIGIVRMFQDLGLGPALVQKRELTKEHINSVFWGMLVLGLFLFLLFAGFAPLIARFYQDSRLTLLIAISAIGFVLTPLFMVHQRLLEREMDFKTMGIVSILVSVLSGSIAIYLAIKGFGVWSLVFYFLLFYVFMPIIIWRFVKWRPKFQFHWQKCKELLGFGLNLSLGKVVSYLRLNIVYLITGKILGASPLGIYRLGDRVVSTPLLNISALFSNALFSSYSKVQDDNERLSRGYLMTLRYIGLVIFPAAAGIIVTAPEIVNVVFGPKWILAIPIIQSLCLLGILNILVNTGVSVAYAKGRSDIVLKWNLLVLIIYIPMIIFFAKFGITAIAMALSIISFPLFIIMQFFINDLIKITWSNYLKNLLNPLVISLVMGFLVSISRLQFLNLNFAQWQILVGKIVLGIFSYSLMIFIFNKKIIKQSWEMFLNK